VVGWYGGSEEYALISSLRFSRETFRKQRLQAPISVTPENHRKADRQMLVDAISPSHSPTLSHIPVDGQTRSYSVLEHPPREAQALEVVSEIGMLRQSTLGADEATALVITDTQQAGLQPPKYAFAPPQKKSSPVSILHLLLRHIGRAAIKL